MCLFHKALAPSASPANEPIVADSRFTGMAKAAHAAMYRSSVANHRSIAPFFHSNSAMDLDEEICEAVVAPNHRRNVAILLIFATLHRYIATLHHGEQALDFCVCIRRMGKCAHVPVHRANVPVDCGDSPVHRIVIPVHCANAPGTWRVAPVHREDVPGLCTFRALRCRGRRVCCDAFRWQVVVEEPDQRASPPRGTGRSTTTSRPLSCRRTSTRAWGESGFGSLSVPAQTR